MLGKLLRLHLAIGWSWLLFGSRLRDLFRLIVEALGGRLGDTLHHILVAGLRRLLAGFGIAVAQWALSVGVQGHGAQHARQADQLGQDLVVCLLAVQEPRPGAERADLITMQINSAG